MPDTPTPFFDALAKGQTPPVTPLTKRPAVSDYDPIIEKHAKRTGFDPDFVRRIIGQESMGHRSAKSWAGAGGLMQLMPDTAKSYGVTDRNDPEQNIRAGTDMLRDLAEQFGGDPQKILAGYNAGATAVQKHGLEKVRKFSNLPKGDKRRNTPADQTTTGHYIDKILDGYQGTAYGKRDPLAQWLPAPEKPEAVTSTTSFDTKLSPREEVRYKKWKAKHAPEDSGDDYDLRGAFRAGVLPDPDNKHWPDKYKKPNHPTFSNESQYATGENASRAGRWEGEKFVPPAGQTNRADLPGWSVQPPAQASDPLSRWSSASTSSAPANSADDELLRKALTPKGTLTDETIANLRWHFGVNDPHDLQKMPREQLRQILTRATQYGIDDQQKREAGQELAPSLEWQNQNRKLVGLGENPVMIDPRAPRPRGPLTDTFLPAQQKAERRLGLQPAASYAPGYDAQKKQVAVSAQPFIFDQPPIDDEALRRHLFQQVVTERQARREGPMTQGRAALAMADAGQGSDAVSQEVERRFESAKAGEVERRRLLSQFSPEDRRNQADVFNRIKNDPDWWKGADVGFTESGASLLRTVAGAADLFFYGGPKQQEYADKVRRIALSGEEALRQVQDETAPLSKKQEASRFVTRTFGDLAQLIPFTAAGGPIAGFAAHSGTQARGMNLSAQETLGETVKGAAIGAAFEVAPLVESGGARFTEKLLDAAKSSAVIGAGTFGVEKLSGAETPDALRAAASNVALHGLAKVAPEIIGQVRELPRAISENKSAPEGVRAAAARMAGDVPIIVRNTETGEYASVFVDPKTGISREFVPLTPEEVKARAHRPVVDATPEEFARVQQGVYQESDPGAPPQPSTAEPINRQLQPEGGMPAEETRAPAPTTPAPPSEGLDAQTPKPAAPTVPESLQTIQTQFEAMGRGERRAVLLPRNTALPQDGEIPETTQLFNLKDGARIFFDPNQVTAAEIAKLEAQQRLHELLGIVEPKSPTTTAVVTATTPDGVEAQTAAVSPERVPEQVREFEQQYPEAQIKTGGAELAQQVIDRRQSGDRRVTEGSAPIHLTERRNRTAQRLRRERTGRRSAERAAEVDVLTGVANQSALIKATPGMERDPNTTILSLDVRNLKAANTILGRDAGDQAIKDAGSAMQQAARENGVTRVFRDSGDEILAGVPNDKAEAIRTRAKELFKPRKAGEYDVGIDIGAGQTRAEADADLKTRKTGKSFREIVPAQETRAVDNADAESDPTWREFAPEHQSLNIPRPAMPQVKSEHRGALTQYLKARGIKHSVEEVAPNQLRPSQAEWSPEKVARAKTFEGPQRPILVSADNYVADGHHQWMSAFTDAPDTPIPIIRLDSPIMPLLMEIARFPSSGVDETSQGTGTGSKIGGTDVAEKPAAAKPEPRRRPEPQRAIREPRAPKTAPVVGKETRVKIPGTDRAYEGRYAVRESADVIASHNPANFQPEPEYHYTNDRRYDREQQYQKQVIDRSRLGGAEGFDPAYVINTSPTAENGPPIIDSDGNVLGGNSRAMIIKRVYGSDDKAAADAYRKELQAQASVFGVDAAQVAQMREPVLVREVDDEKLQGNEAAQRAITELNVTGTTPLTHEEQSAAGAQQISDAAASFITDMIEVEGEDATIANVMDRKGVAIINRLIEDGIFSAGDRNRLLKDGKPTAEAKARVEALLVGALYRDLAQMQATPAGVRRNVERIVVPVRSVAGTEWDISEDLKGAIDAVIEARATGLGQDFEKLRLQASMVRAPFSDREVALAKVLVMGPVKTAKRFRSYAHDYQEAQLGTNLFGTPPSRAESAEFNLGALESKRARSSEQLGFVTEGLVQQQAPAQPVQQSTALAKREHLFVDIDGERFPYTTAEDAARRARHAIDTLGVGASETPPIRIITQDGEDVGHVSYNGRVWEGRYDAWPNNTLVYDPSAPQENPLARWSEAHVAASAKAFGMNNAGRPMLEVIRERATSADVRTIADALEKYGDRFSNAEGEDFIRALDKLTTLRATHTPLEEYLRQGSFFGPDLSEQQQSMLRLFARSTKDAVAFIKKVATSHKDARDAVLRQDLEEFRAEPEPEEPTTQGALFRAAPDSAEFKRWFGDSKIVDEAGEPLVVYHFTSPEAKPLIDAGGFDLSKGRARLSDEGVPDGIFFTPEAKPPFGDAMEFGRISAYLKMESPLRVENRDALKDWASVRDAEYARLRAALSKYTPEVYGELYRRFQSEDEATKSEAALELATLVADATEARARLTASLRSEGHDGVVMERDEGGPQVTKTYVVLEPTQVKSTENRGAFDPNKPSILERRREMVMDQLAQPSVKTSELLGNLAQEYRNGVLYVNPHTMELLRRVNQSITGTHAEPSDGLFINRAVLTLYQGRLRKVVERFPERTKEVKDLGRALRFAAAENMRTGSSGVPIIGVYPGDRALQLKAAIQHERSHGASEAGAEGKPYSERVDVAAVAAHPLSERIFTALVQKFGYADYKPQLIEEAQAWLTSKEGAESLGLTTVEAGEWLNAYFTSYAERNGPEALKRFRKLRPAAAKEVANAYRQAIERQGARAGERTQSGAIREVSDRRPAGDAAGAGALAQHGPRGPDSEAFRQWFGDSKVVKADGQPLVVYHGTPAGGKITEFRQGAFFAESADAAAAFMRGRRGDKRGKRTIYPAYLAISNPVDLRAHRVDENFSVEKFADACGIPRDEYVAKARDLAASDLAKQQKAMPDLEWEINDFGMVVGGLHSGFGLTGFGINRLWSILDLPITAQVLQSFGFDGVRSHESYRTKKVHTESDIWQSFEPTQVKSATGNAGTFDPTKPSILEKRREGEQPTETGQLFDDEQPVPPFYSRLQRTIEDLMPARASVEQVRNLINNPQSGVKADEIKWTGFDDWLSQQQGQVSRDVAISYLRMNAVELQEKQFGGMTPAERRFETKRLALRKFLIEEKDFPEWDIDSYVSDASLDKLTGPQKHAAQSDTTQARLIRELQAAREARVGAAGKSPRELAAEAGTKRQELVQARDNLTKRLRANALRAEEYYVTEKVMQAVNSGYAVQAIWESTLNELMAQLPLRTESKDSIRAEIERVKRLSDETSEAETAAREAAAEKGVGPAKYEKYSVPGETSEYREIIFTLPERLPGTEFEHQVRPRMVQAIKSIRPYSGTASEIGDQHAGMDMDDLRRLISFERDGIDPTGRMEPEEIDNAREIQRDLERAGYGPLIDEYRLGHSRNGALEASRRAAFRSTHWHGHENVLAHTRLDDRQTVDGKRVLFTNEVQSDWHQIGRKKGYRDAPATELPDGYYISEMSLSRGAEGQPHFEVTDREGNSVITDAPSREDAKRRALDRLNRVTALDTELPPQGPLAKTWHEFVMRRLLREAAEGGYEYLAWVTGEQAADLYDLSKHIGSIEYRPDPGDPNRTILRVWDTQGEGLHEHFNEIIEGARWVDHDAAMSIPNEKLEDLVGKEVAERILNGEGEPKITTADSFKLHRRNKVDAGVDDPKPLGYRELAGLDLKVGGEGMQGFYDKMIPAFMRKLARKWGAKVEDIALTASTKGTVHEQGRPTGVVQVYPSVWSLTRENRDDPYGFYDTVDQAETALKSEQEEYDTGLPHTTVHAITITPQMKQSVLHEGQPLFMKRPKAPDAADAFSRNFGDSDEPEQPAQRGRVGGYYPKHTAPATPAPTPRPTTTPTPAAPPAPVPAAAPGGPAPPDEELLAEADRILADAKAKSYIRRIIDGARKLPREMQRTFTAEFTPLRLAEEKLAGKQDLDIAAKAELLPGATGMAELDLLEFQQSVVSVIAKLHHDFNRYILFRRTKDRLEHDPDRKQVGTYTVERVDQALAALHRAVGDVGWKRLEKAGQAYQEASERTLQLRLATGMISKEVYDAIKAENDFYAPFVVMKYVSDEMSKPAGSGRRIPHTEDLIKRITGIRDEDFQLQDFVLSAAEQIYQTRILAEKNAFMRDDVAPLAELDAKNELIREARPTRYYRIEYKPAEEILAQLGLQSQVLEQSFVKVGRAIELAEEMGLTVNRKQMEALGRATLGGAEGGGRISLRAFVSEVIAHEMGHSVDVPQKDAGGNPITKRRNVFGTMRDIVQRLSSEINTNRQYQREMKALVAATGLGGDEKYRASAKERWSEFISLYIHNPKRARSLAPLFTDHFEKNILPHPLVKRLVEGLAGFFQQVDGLPNILTQLKDLDDHNYLELALRRAFPDRAPQIGVRFGDQPRQGYSTVEYLDSGTVKMLEVRDDIAQALEGLHRGEGSIISKAAAMAAQPFRWGATSFNLAFQPVNLFLADLPRAALISRYGVQRPEDLIRFPADWLYAFFTSVTGNFGYRNALFEDFMRSGAYNANIQRELTPEAFKPAMGVEKEHIAKRALYTVPRLAAAIEDTSKILGIMRGKRLTNFDQQSPERQKELIRSIASEVRRYSGSPDFWRKGTVSTGQTLENMNLIFVFFNARVQGVALDFARLAGKGQGGGKAAAAAWIRLALAVGLPALTLMLWNLGDDEKELDGPEGKWRQTNRESYAAVPEWERENNFMIPRDRYFINDRGDRVRDYWRIPKREIVKLMANMIETGVQFADRHDGAHLRRFGVSFLENVSPINISGQTFGERAESVAGSTNPVIKVPIELIFNRDTFRHRDVIPDYIDGVRSKDLPPGEQYTRATGDPYVKIGQAMGVSPMLVEHATKGATAGLLTQFLPPKPQPGRPEALSYPVIGAVARRFVRSEATTKDSDDEVLTTAIKDATTARAKVNREAFELYRSWKREPQGRTVREYITSLNATPQIAEEVAGFAEEDAKNLTTTERAILQLGVSNGDRARYLLKLLEGKEETERKAMIDDWRKKDIVSDKVYEQLITPQARQELERRLKAKRALAKSLYEIEHEK